MQINKAIQIKYGGLKLKKYLATIIPAIGIPQQISIINA